MSRQSVRGWAHCFVAKPMHEKQAAAQATLRAYLKFAQDLPKHIQAAARLGVRLDRRGRGIPTRFLFYGLSPGDDLLCTAVLRELWQRGERRVAMVSNHSKLFLGNPDAACVLPAGKSFYHPPLSTYRHLARLLGREFNRPEYAQFDGKDHSAPPSRHVIAELCAGVGITGPVVIRPYLSLTELRKGSRGLGTRQDCGPEQRHGRSTSHGQQAMVCRTLSGSRRTRSGTNSSLFS